MTTQDKINRLCQKLTHSKEPNLSQPNLVTIEKELSQIQLYFIQTMTQFSQKLQTIQKGISQFKNINNKHQQQRIQLLRHLDCSLQNRLAELQQQQQTSKIKLECVVRQYIEFLEQQSYMTNNNYESAIEQLEELINKTEQLDQKVKKKGEQYKLRYMNIYDTFLKEIVLIKQQTQQDEKINNEFIKQIKLIYDQNIFEQKRQLQKMKSDRSEKIQKIMKSLIPLIGKDQ